MANEDQKQAVSIVTTLSGQLMAAALAMIALEGTFLTFALDKKVCGFWFWVFVTTSFSVFAVSIILGGKGVTILYKTGAAGNWNYAEGNGRFQGQTGLCLVGLILFGLAVVSAQKDKLSDAGAIKDAISMIATNVDKQSLVIQQFAVQLQSHESNTSSAKIEELQSQVQALRSEVERMKGTFPPTITNLVQIAGITNVIQIGSMTNFFPAQPSLKSTSIHRWGIGIGAERLN